MDPAPDIVYTIGDKERYIKFIRDLREKLAKHSDGTKDDILEGNRAGGAYPVLPKQHPKPERWLHIKLCAVEGEETFATTLAIRDDNVYCKGFRNQKGDWYELCGREDLSEQMLPYKSSKLPQWDVTYRGILKHSDQEQVKQTLRRMKLGKAFATRAVRSLSRYPDENEELARESLAGLIVMVCESARMNPFLHTLAGGWDKGTTGLTEQLMDYLWDWADMSSALLNWRDKKDGPSRKRASQSVVKKGESSPGDAFACVHLVLNYKKPKDQPSENDDVRGPVRPRVQIFAVRADIPVVIMTITDGKRRQIIYQGDQGMGDLVLSRVNKTTSAHMFFGIEVKTMPTAAGSDMASSSSGGAGNLTSWVWEWDCFNSDHATDIDAPSPVTRPIGPASGPNNIKVTYLVMSSALDATVEVKLRLKDSSHIILYGEIAARIHDFGDRIVLFRSSKQGNVLLPSDSSILPLVQSVIAVPFNYDLHIEVDLHIETCHNKVVKPAKFELSFPCGCSSPRQKVNDDEVAVSISWYPEKIKPDIVWTIKNHKGFSTFIEELRSMLADHDHPEDVLEDYPEPKPSTYNHPVLTNACPGTQCRLIHIKIQLEREETSTTLAVRYDDLSVVGFMNQNRVWYELGDRPNASTKLPPQYNSVALNWGTINYGESVIALEEITRTLRGKNLGKAMAERAVRMLSRYQALDDDDDNPRLELAGLAVLICESAKMNRFHDFVTRAWTNGRGLTKELEGCMFHYKLMSRALLYWKDAGYKKWPQIAGLLWFGINNQEDALNVICLVHNNRSDPEAHMWTLID